MMVELQKQAERFGAECVFQTVDSVDLSDNPFVVNADNKKYAAEAIIISTGASARLLGLESEARLMGHGVSACATCDGFFFKNKKVLVVGGGDSAMEEATFLTKFASEVVIIHRRKEFRASKIMVERAVSNPKISFRYNQTIDEIIGTKDTGVQSVMLKDTLTNEITKETCDGIFMAIGHVPNTSLFKGMIDLDESGYIITNPDSSHTTLKGVFA